MLLSSLCEKKADLNISEPENLVNLRAILIMEIPGGRSLIKLFKTRLSFFPTLQSFENLVHCDELNSGIDGLVASVMKATGNAYGFSSLKSADQIYGEKEKDEWKIVACLLEYREP